MLECGTKKKAMCVVMQSVSFVGLHIVLSSLHICINILVFLSLKHGYFLDILLKFFFFFSVAGEN